MHEGDIGLSLLGTVFTAVLEFGPLLAALVVTVDAIRRCERDFEGSIPGGRWTWIVPNVLLLFAVLLGMAGVTGSVLGLGIVALYVVVVVLDLAYLLRVVFPAPSRRAARELAITTVGRLPEE